eukprot:2387791-Rhodomonas_salina.1
MEENLQWANDIILASGGYVEEAAVHISVLESSATARAHAVRWGDPVWEEMKLSFARSSRLHMMEE